MEVRGESEANRHGKHADERQTERGTEVTDLQLLLVFDLIRIGQRLPRGAAVDTSGSSLVLGLIRLVTAVMRLSPLGRYATACS